jgi:hypothetical protein
LDSGNALASDLRSIPDRLTGLELLENVPMPFKEDLPVEGCSLRSAEPHAFAPSFGQAGVDPLPKSLHFAAGDFGQKREHNSRRRVPLAAREERLDPLRLTHPFAARDRQAGYRYDLSILQAEFSLTQIWENGCHGRQFFEEVIRENIDLGRPEQVQLIFERKLQKKTVAEDGSAHNVRALLKGLAWTWPKSSESNSP